MKGQAQSNDVTHKYVTKHDVTMTPDTCTACRMPAAEKIPETSYEKKRPMVTSKLKCPPATVKKLVQLTLDPSGIINNKSTFPGNSKGAAKGRVQKKGKGRDLLKKINFGQLRPNHPDQPTIKSNILSYFKSVANIYPIDKDLQN